MPLGKNTKRQDAIQKVTGTAQYVEDLVPLNALHVKVVHSTIANGMVKAIHTEKAEAMPGVELVLTCFDVPNHIYPTAGHPLSLDPAHEDIKDKLILEKRVRFYGDDIAAVVADTPLHAMLAAEQVEVEYEEETPLLGVADAYGNESVLHGFRPKNELARMDFTIDGEGNTRFYNADFSTDSKIAGRADMIGDHYRVPRVHACHMENNGCFAYMDGDRIVVYSCNQVPFTLRQNIAMALSVSPGRIRVVKPYLGGGFGNKQDTMYEPLVAFLTTKLGGRPVSLQLTREETFVNTRTRHAFDMNMYTEVGDDMKIKRKGLRINSDGGAYAAHNHAVAAYAITNNFQTYITEGEQVGESSTMYTNLPSAAALRGYGIPQLSFAMESQMDDIAKKHGWDPVEFRLQNIQRAGFVDPFDKFVEEANGFEECITKGRDMSDWIRKRKEYTEFNKNSKERKRGIGMAGFCYKTGVWPLQLESGACRIVMNPDASCQLQIGATELGQGSDTVFAQMVSEITSIPEEKITTTPYQDTDISPYDNGAYASRQTYVSGGAVKKTAFVLKDKILKHAEYILEKQNDGWNLKDQAVADRDGNKLITIEEICRFMNYTNDLKTDTAHITAEATYTAKGICFSYGVSYMDIIVDVPVGRVKINKVWSVHDSGKILNPQLAAAQLHGGIAMGIGYALGEQLMFDPKTGKARNNNLLDYKIPTAMDIPEMETAFVEPYEPTGPFGNKGLAEPPLIPQAPAIRNAILHATGVPFYELPMNPQRLVHGFREAGIIRD